MPNAEGSNSNYTMATSNINVSTKFGVSGITEYWGSVRTTPARRALFNTKPSGTFHKRGQGFSELAPLMTFHALFVDLDRGSMARTMAWPTTAFGTSFILPVARGRFVFFTPEQATLYSSRFATMGHLVLSDARLSKQKTACSVAVSPDGKTILVEYLSFVLVRRIVRIAEVRRSAESLKPLLYR